MCPRPRDRDRLRLVEGPCRPGVGRTDRSRHGNARSPASWISDRVLQLNHGPRSRARPRGIRRPRHRRPGRRHRTVHNERRHPRRARTHRAAAARPRIARHHRAPDPAVRVHDIATDRDGYGFPPNHPEMHDCSGPDRRAKGPRSIGRLYLTNKQALRRPSARTTNAWVEMFALARRHRHRERPAARAGPAPRDRRGARADRAATFRRHHPEHLRGRSLAGRRAGVDGGRAGRGASARRESHRFAGPTIRDIRNFIFGLRPELLEQAGLVGGLAALADEFRRQQHGRRGR